MTLMRLVRDFSVLIVLGVMAAVGVWFPVREGTASVLANDGEPRTTVGQSGVLSVAHAAHRLGHRFDERVLFRSEHASSPAGSSIAEMSDAIRAIGLEATVFRHAPLDWLLRQDSPVIFHVRGVPWDRELNHFVSVHGSDGTKVVLYDALWGVSTVSVDVLASRWGRTAILVGRGPTRMPLGWRMPTPLLVVMGVLVAIVAAWTTAWLCSARSGLVATVATAGALVLGGLVVTVFEQRLTSGGLLRSTDSFIEIDAWHSLPSVPFWDADGVDAKESLVLIDARSFDSFRTEHIPGAVALPMNELMTGRLPMPPALLDHRGGVVVYCSNADCPYAGYTAQYLRARGVSSVYVLKGGIEGWKGQGKRTSSTVSAREGVRRDR